MPANATKKILIVDDDEDIRINIRDILEDIGYETKIAKDGETALELISKARASHNCDVDLCLLDYKMPGMNGAELFDLISRQCPKVQAIIISAFTGEDGIQKALEAGVSTVLRKPVDIPNLLAMIEKLDR